MVHTLFKQCYVDWIVACWDALLTLNPELKTLNTYNEAVKLEFEMLKVDSPEEYEQLEQSVILMHDSALKEFRDQMSEVQKR
jgi:hypothetical protein